MKALQGIELGDLVVLPPNVLNTDGLFLDNLKIPELEEKLHTKICVPDYGLRELYEILF